jgi:hypothetical protein
MHQKVCLEIRLLALGTLKQSAGIVMKLPYPMQPTFSLCIGVYEPDKAEAGVSNKRELARQRLA